MKQMSLTKSLPSLLEGAFPGTSGMGDVVNKGEGGADGVTLNPLVLDSVVTVVVCCCSGCSDVGPLLTAVGTG
jgi:hypothetical protein